MVYDIVLPTLLQMGSGEDDLCGAVWVSQVAPGPWQSRKPISFGNIELSSWHLHEIMLFVCYSFNIFNTHTYIYISIGDIIWDDLKICPKKTRNNPLRLSFFFSFFRRSTWPCWIACCGSLWITTSQITWLRRTTLWSTIRRDRRGKLWDEIIVPSDHFKLL